MTAKRATAKKKAEELVPFRFTQYLRPNGRPVPVDVDLPKSLAATGERCRIAGVRFEIEELMSGAISMTAEIYRPDPEGMRVLSSAICPNGPAVVDKVTHLIHTAARSAFVQGRTK